MENFVNYNIIRNWYENLYQQGGEVLFFDYYPYLKNTWENKVKIIVNNEHVPNGWAFPNAINFVKGRTNEFVNTYVDLALNNKNENFWKDHKLSYKLDDFNHCIHFLYFLYEKHDILIPPVLMYDGEHILPVHGQGRVYNLAAFHKKINCFYVKYKNDIYPNYNYEIINSSSRLWSLITENIQKKYKITTTINYLKQAMPWPNKQNVNYTFFWILIDNFHLNFTKNYQIKALEIWKACQENTIRLGQTTIYL